MSPPSAIEVSAVSDTSGVTIPNPLSAPVQTNEVNGRRRKTNAAQWGVAAPSDTANFRLRSHDHKPKAKKWSRVFSPLIVEISWG
jgi:aromatic amino acid aminotransferase I